MKKFLRYFSPFEWCLWGASCLTVTLSYLLSGDFHTLALFASLLGVTALIFLAKGNVIGQALCAVFALLYALVSYEQRYFGEMLTYLCMTLPSAIVAVISWLKHPSKRGVSEVQIARMTRKKWILVCLLTGVVTLLFYFVLAYFQTNKLLVSTLSVATSFFASTLTILRSPFYAIAYACNDIVLIVLWIFASIAFIGYLPMVFCFFAFLANDSYAFITWRKLQREQSTR